MISESKECYVYITLPGQTDFVTAGRFTLTTDRLGNALGRFIYSKNYLNRSDAVPIDPVELRLSTKMYETTLLNGMFGSIRDAGPDYWGRRVIERHAKKSILNEIDYLLYSPDDRAGALGFGLNQIPPSPKYTFNQTIDLARLQNIATTILKNEALSDKVDNDQIKNLMLIGTSMGGARPKTVIEDEKNLWIAKFNRLDDQWNNARVEHAMLNLARNCGINTAESRIIEAGGRDVLLVKRFDREKVTNGYLRSRMISALTLLRADDVYTSRDKWSYVSLVEELRRICAAPEENAQELFRRMCFNALISNIDDHPRNHAFIAKNNEWKLSPAYDLTPSVPVSASHRDLALICGDAGRYANVYNLISQCSRFFINRDQAIAIIDTMEETIKNTWYSVARSAGVSENDCREIDSAFAYPGFRQTL